jgi:hypothetical protein
VSRTKIFCRCFEHCFFAREVEDQDSENLTASWPHPAGVQRGLILNVEPKPLGVRDFSLLRSGFHDAGVAGGKKTSCGRGCGVDREGVPSAGSGQALRLRRVMRFARDPAALWMTGRFFSRTFASRGTCPTVGWTGGDARRSINKSPALASLALICC